MKTTAFYISLICVFIAAPTVWAQDVHEDAKSKPVLRILNWRDYIDVDDSLPETLPIEERSPTLRKFAAEHNCKIEYYEYDDFDDIVPQFMDRGGFYDVVVVSCNNAQAIIGANWLLPIPQQDISNIRYIDKDFLTSPADPEGRFLVPYLSDYVGLVYNPTYISEKDVTWRNYFNPPDVWKGGHIGLFDSATVMFAAAAIANGVEDYGHLSLADIEQAKETIAGLCSSATPMLVAQTDEMQQKMVDGELWIAPAYSPNANAIVGETALKFVIPPEGSEYYIDYLVIHRDSRNVELAAAFINYVLQPATGGRIAAYLGVDVPSAEARRIQQEIAPPNIPVLMDEKGHIPSKMQITYELNPNIQAGWLEILSTRPLQ